MGLEIERKFLVKNAGWMSGSLDKVSIVQRYISTEPAIRVRLTEGEAFLKGEAFLTIKSSGSGMTRSEFEYEIPYIDAIAMSKEIPMNIVNKTRYYKRDGELLWEIDVFNKDNDGLIVAEIELTHEDQEIPSYAWLGEEVTDDRRYYNADLAMNPYKNWKD